MDTMLVPERSRRERGGRAESTARARGGSSDRPRIVLVGPCAAGKSTLADALQGRGYDAHGCAQEHSAVPHLWALSEPDLLIYLSVGLAAIRQRRADPSWPAFIYVEQQQRLAHALAHCDLYIDTAPRDPAGVLAVALVGIAAATGHGESMLVVEEH